jgi:FkbM family methyltransferase
MKALAALRLKARFEWWAPHRSGRYPSFHSSHSQFGEDMVVRALFGDRRSGTYADIGAHHPVYYSNTHHFYQKGWRGLNVDALPGAMDEFRVLRPGDVNVEACIIAAPGRTVTLYLFEDAALSTTDAAAAHRHQADGKQLVGTRQVEGMTLGECLGRHLPDRPIDFLTIDIEGMDAAILRSNDWERYAPSVLVFERHDLSMVDAADDPLIRFLAAHGYALEAKCGPSFVMRHARRWSSTK